MAKFYLRLFIGALAVAFCIFFGVDMASKGVERVQGPTGPVLVKPVPAAPPKQETKPAAAATSNGAAAAAGKGADKAKSEGPERAAVTADSGINRISNKAGELLQIMAYHGIKFFVSMMDAIWG